MNTIFIYRMEHNCVLFLTCVLSLQDVFFGICLIFFYFIELLCGQDFHYLLTDYVDAMKKLLFAWNEDEITSVFQQYTKKIPEPMNRKFEERLSKEEAIQKHKARKSLPPAELFPPGNYNILQHN
jgi:hypothetical protein